MFFTDDSYIFCKATSESANNVSELLKVFEISSGQQINVDKSSVFFSRNTPCSVKRDLCQQLRFSEATDQTLYLGLPNTIGRNKSSIFDFLKEKMQSRIQGWEKKMLLNSGKEILLNTVSQMLSNYTMGVFLLPMNLCQ